MPERRKQAVRISSWSWFTAPRLPSTAMKTAFRPGSGWNSLYRSAGATPFDPKELRTAGVERMRKIIREQEPVPPSSRFNAIGEPEVARLSQHRQSEPAKLSALLRKDLDWIAMKCLEKDRARRYATA